MIGSNFDTPIMYQDLANYTMSPMNPTMMPFGGMTGSSYLGGVQMQRQLDHDKVQLKNKKKEEAKNTFKNAMIAAGLILGLGFIPTLRKSVKNAGGIGKFFKNQWNNLVNWVKGSGTPKQSFWQRIKNKFKKKPNNNQNNNQQKVSLWQKFKNFFKKKPQNP